jgi:Uma2 family endonuclease
MSQPAEQRPGATYADWEAVPPHQVAELINGTLYIFSRPGPKHTDVASVLGVLLGGPFRLGRGGPGGWWILHEPELQFPNPAVKAGKDVLQPDLAGWRRERLPKLPEIGHFALAPDWICEILSDSTEKVDREEKMPIYAREGVRHAWLVDPIARTLEVYALGEQRRWSRAVVHRDDVRVRVEPFDAIDLDLSLLWAE